MDDSKVEKWTLDDGRRAERRIKESEDGERVIELHVEAERPLQLTQRVVEKSKPIVYERKIETLDAQGNVVEQKVESIEPRVQMQVVEHIASEQHVNALSLPQEEDCTVTRKEMIDTIVAAIKAANLNNNAVSNLDNQHAMAPKVNFASELHSLGLADEIGVRVKSQGMSTKDKVFMGVSVIIIGILIYMLLV